MEASEGHEQPICLGKCILSRGPQGIWSWAVELLEARAKEDHQEESKPEAWSWMLGSLDSGSKEWLPESASRPLRSGRYISGDGRNSFQKGDGVNEPIYFTTSLLPFLPNFETGETKVPRPGGRGGGDVLKQATLGPKAYPDLPWPHDLRSEWISFLSLCVTEWRFVCAVLVPGQSSDNPCLGLARQQLGDGVFCGQTMLPV